MSQRRVLASCLTVAVLAAFSRDALAYRTVADLPDYPDDQRIRWSSGVFEYQVHEVVPEWLPIGTLTATSQQALEAWSSSECSGISSVYSGLTPDRAESGDGINTIEVIASGWEALAYERDAVGATALELQERDGFWEIVEADIRINAEHHQWSASDAPSDGRRSLLGTLRHEAGHALGLLHPCEDNDDAGAPPCDGTRFPEDAIMYPYYSQSQSELLNDDHAGICYLYPECEVSGCAPGFDCTSSGCMLQCDDTHCAEGELCVDGACQSSSDCSEGCPHDIPSWLVACDEATQCPNGLCSPDGDCAVACLYDDECPAGSSCGFGENPNDSGYCAPSLKGLGERCEQSNQCVEGECLAGARAHPICTHECGSESTACPEHWSCDSVEGRSVCVPPRAARGCGFDTPQSTHPSRFSAFHFLGLAALAAGTRRRLRRT